MPGCDWASLAEAAAPIVIDAVAGEMYIDTDLPHATQAEQQEAPRSVEEAVTLELQLSDDLEPSELERRRRTFAYRNHPDRFRPAHQAWALRRMTVCQRPHRPGPQDGSVARSIGHRISRRNRRARLDL